MPKLTPVAYAVALRDCGPRPTRNLAALHGWLCRRHTLRVSRFGETVVSVAKAMASQMDTFDGLAVACVGAGVRDLIGRG